MRIASLPTTILSSYDIPKRAHAAHHLGEGDVLRRFRCSDDEASVLLRKEALRYRHEEIACSQDGRDEDRERNAMMAQCDVESPAIACEEPQSPS
jgi:hypothetical protein